MDLTEVRADIEALLSDRAHDDGSYAPLFIRLSWHCSGTYDKTKGNGGSNGGTMRFKAEQADPENKGLGKAIKRLEPVCKKHPHLSKADIYVLAGTVAIEATGGPRITFAHGRRDYSEAEARSVYGNKGGCPFGGKDGEVSPHGSRLPAADMGAVEGCPFEAPMSEQEAPTIAAMRSVFDRLGFTDKETVCLIVLGHQYGRCHPEISGYENPWYSFDPTHYSIHPHGLGYMTAQVMCERGYREETTTKGKRQYGMRMSSRMDPFMMLITDMCLVWDPEYKKSVLAYDSDREAFREDAAVAWKKLIELGCDGILTEESTPAPPGRARQGMW